MNIQDIPKSAKNIGDGTAIASAIMSIINVLNPIVEFAVLVATAVWFYFRARDMYLSNKLKQKELDK